MAASAYDVAGIGLAPICIETAEGKREYVQQQKALFEQGQLLRRRLIAYMQALEAWLTSSNLTANADGSLHQC